MAENASETDNMTPEQVAELQKQNCVFCKIAKKEIPSKVLHETDKIICVLDINPASEGHLIVFPKEHYMILPHIPPDVSQEMFKITKLMSNTLLKSLQCKGTSIFIANGMAAGQKAPHVLVHIFPRTMGDGLLEFEPKDLTDEAIAKMSAQMKAYIPQVLGDTARKQAVPEKAATKEKSLPVKEENADTQEATDSQDEIASEEDNKQTKGRQGHKSSSNEEKTPKRPKTVDLDSISKLFG